MPKLSWNRKEYILEEPGEIRKKRIYMLTVWLLICSQAMFSPLKTWKKDKVQVPQPNKLLCLYYTALGFTSKMTIIPNKIPNGRCFNNVARHLLVPKKTVWDPKFFSQKNFCNFLVFGFTKQFDCV